MFWCSLPSFPFLWLLQTSAQLCSRAMTEAEPLLQKVLKCQFCLDSQSGFKITFSDTICGFSLHIIGHVWKHPVYRVHNYRENGDAERKLTHQKPTPARYPDPFPADLLKWMGSSLPWIVRQKHSLQSTQLCQQLPSSAIVRQCPWHKRVLGMVCAIYTQGWVIDRKSVV